MPVNFLTVEQKQAADAKKWPLGFLANHRVCAEKLRIQGKPTTFIGQLHCEPIGEEWNGQYKPLTELTYYDHPDASKWYIESVESPGDEAKKLKPGVDFTVVGIGDSAPTISGSYNYRQYPSGEIFCWTSRSPKQLFELLFTAIGERVVVIDGPILTRDGYPTVTWRNKPVAQAIDELCEMYNLMVVAAKDCFEIRSANKGNAVDCDQPIIVYKNTPQ